MAGKNNFKEIEISLIFSMHGTKVEKYEKMQCFCVVHLTSDFSLSK